MRPVNGTGGLLRWAAAAVAVVASGCGHGDKAHALLPLAPHGASEAPRVDDLVFEVPPPPFKRTDLHPCMECHKDLETDAARRALGEPHEDIVLRHDEEHRWCLDCHDAKERDSLRLANGTLVRFEESYKLCGQCHGDKYRDWRAGVHGRRTGSWDGQKQYLLCVHCHDSHAPKFKPMKPLPPPTPPGSIR